MTTHLLSLQLSLSAAEYNQGISNLPNSYKPRESQGSVLLVPIPSLKVHLCNSHISWLLIIIKVTAMAKLCRWDVNVISPACL